MTVDFTTEAASKKPTALPLKDAAKIQFISLRTT